VAEKNRTKALAPTAVLRSPNRRTGGEQLPFVMRRTILLIIFMLLFMNLYTHYFTFLFFFYKNVNNQYNILFNF